MTNALNDLTISSKSISILHTHVARGRVPDASQPGKEPLSTISTQARRIDSAKPTA
jgi:hypothetical protein